VHVTLCLPFILPLLSVLFVLRASHATLMGKIRNACAILDGDEYKILFNKLSCRWKDGMKTILEKSVSNV
jgi:hypothetical protein